MAVSEYDMSCGWTKVSILYSLKDKLAEICEMKFMTGLCFQGFTEYVLRLARFIKLCLK